MRVLNQESQHTYG